jgi:Ribbon-helix-helix protein, copG family
VTARRHVPPSRLRYEATHPTVAVHCDVETKARLVALREATGLSLGELVKQALGLLERDVDVARQIGLADGRAEGRSLGVEEGHVVGEAEGYNLGFAEADARYRVCYPCAVCGSLISILVDSAEAKVMVKALVDARWAHAACRKKRRQS